MPLFKSNKNKSASAASTPAQTPRSSMQETRPKTTAMTPEEALQKVMNKSMRHPLRSSGAAKHPRMTPPKTTTTTATATMPLFKSNKIKSASAASTPAQTPRSSIQATRPKATTMTPEEALQMIMEKSVNGVGCGPSLL
ncbi:hypothetical protein B0O80DRAFT_525038 [Mortierella sp. GBAus27b]|nr:hypothetical protein B0O80DRAFT_525038 [Mortierella sp. GBAus27b]